MLRWIVLAVVVVALTAAATYFSVREYGDTETLAVAAVPEPKGPHPKVEVPGPWVYEFGSMSQLSGGKHTWEFKNLGDADLELWVDSQTCSCTIAKLKSENGEEKKKLVVKPHESTTIDLEWQTKVFHDDYKKGATIGTNDPTQPAVGIYVHGTVQPPVVVYPNEMIAFHGISNEEPHTAMIGVFSPDRPKLKIKKLSTSRPEFIVAHSKPFTAQDCEQFKVKGGYQVIVDVKPGMPLGRFHEELVLETDHPHRPDLKVSITGSVTGPISVIPERVRITNVSSGQGGARDVTLLVRGGRPTKFTVARHPEKLRIEITPDDTKTQKGRYKMTVIVPPGTAAGPVDGDIVLQTDHPKVSEMRIPVSILISNSGAG